MDKIPLGSTGRQTTRLGYGCSSLMGAMGRRESLAILEGAYDAGIRHFDVAPMYGYGEAEGCLGEFLTRHRSDITITTKYGIPPAKHSPLIKLARRVVGPVIKTLPGLKQRLARAANASTRNHERASFTAEQAQASLERSLTVLRTDYIDVWLLHEVEAVDLEDDGLLRFLEDQVAKGTIGTFGVGSEGVKVGSLLAQRRAYCRTLQFEWSVLDAPVSSSESFRIHHRALTANFRALREALTRQPGLCRRWSASVGEDLSHSASLANLMLKTSLLMNPESVILFSSKNPRHIQANVRVEGDSSIDSAARKFHELIRSEENPLLPGNSR